MAVELPGRAHLGEQPAATFDDLLNALIPQLLPWLDKPFVFYGHSYGALVAFALLGKLKQRASGLVVSSRRAPHLPSAFRQASLLPDDQFLEEMQAMYQAIPQAVLQEKELLQLLLPILKEDIRINETYVACDDHPLDVPIELFYGTEDKTISQDELEAWKNCTTARCCLNSCGGGHFFIEHEKPKIIQSVTKFLGL